MLKKLFLALMFTAVSLFAMNFQTASKEELMSIKGIGEKRAAAIIKYRKTHTLKSAADLENVPGIGKEVADNAKKGLKNADTKKVSKSTKKSTSTSIKEKTKATKTKEKTIKSAGDKTKKAEKKATEKAKKSLKKTNTK